MSPYPMQCYISSRRSVEIFNNENVIWVILFEVSFFQHIFKLSVSKTYPIITVPKKTQCAPQNLANDQTSWVAHLKNHNNEKIMRKCISVSYANNLFNSQFFAISSSFSYFPNIALNLSLLAFFSGPLRSHRNANFLVRHDRKINDIQNNILYFIDFVDEFVAHEQTKNAWLRNFTISTCKRLVL